MTGKRKRLDFSKPRAVIERVDSAELREKILNISYYEWKKMGFSKGTLHYMKKNAESGGPFTIYRPVREKLQSFR